MSYELTEEQKRKCRSCADWFHSKAWDWNADRAERQSRAEVLARAIAEPMAARIKVLEDALRTIKFINDGEYPSIDSQVDEALRGGKKE